jgi:hypothetical protein
MAADDCVGPDADDLRPGHGEVVSLRLLEGFDDGGLAT